MIKRLLALDGVMAVAQFRDDGQYLEGYGLMPDDQLENLTHFARDYKRIVQGNADQLSMFTQQNGWTPPGGWIVRGQTMSVCSIGNLVCVMQNAQANVTEVMKDLAEAASY